MKARISKQQTTAHNSEENTKPSHTRRPRRTKKIWLRLIALLLVIAAGLGVVHYLKPLFAKKYPESSFGVAPYYSETDADRDGLDDQSDLLASTRYYLSTHPEYRSKYYQGGWPDDGYGVCTDVVAFTLKDCGYDLQQLVDEDIRQNPDVYGIAQADSNIDYRRVSNLKLWFERHAVSLSTDFSDPSAWHGGDIIIFTNHIGVVSDQRNAQGVPFILHHYSPFQLTYEEDVLGSRYQREDIAGHYRIS